MFTTTVLAMRLIPLLPTALYALHERRNVQAGSESAELLRQVQAEEREANRGKLKIFLGYASGVGKSHRMLDEGRRRRKRGQDVVVGAVQPTLPPDVKELLNQLEVIALRDVGGSPVMDLDAILRRHPGVCIIDGLAYDNPPGSRHDKRWQDVEEILAAGISVVTSLNLQYIEEHREQVEQITGKTSQHHSARLIHPRGR